MEPLPLATLPPRPADTHKGSYGAVLIAAGCRAYPGAAILAALGAGRGGAGLVRLGLPEGLVAEVLPAVPFATVVRCPADDQGGLAAAAVEPLLAVADEVDAVVLGPGWGRGPGAAVVLEALVPALGAPLVLDADALNLLADGRLDLLAERPGPTVLTPHPGEFARLTGAPAPASPTARVTDAAALARRTGAVVVLKGSGTVTSDGRRTRVEPAGNPGMATGGSGDVLAGLTGALLARLPGDPAATAALAVHRHALAGDLAAAELGQEGLLPTDLAERLGRVDGDQA